MSREPNGEPAGNEENSVHAACGSAVPTERLSVNTASKNKCGHPHSELKKIAARPARSKFQVSKSLLSFLLFIALTSLTACDRGRERANVLTGRGEPEVTVMDFSVPFSLNPPPAGWYHRTFWTRWPMQMAFAVKGGVPSLRFETRSTASMLFRHVDLDLADYQFLIWRWYIEEPIESPLDGHTREGDDHPARLFLVFQTATGEERRMEIIWGNKLKAGDYKYIGGFPHYGSLASAALHHHIF